MALLFMDGFDAGDYTLKYTVPDGSGVSSSTTTPYSSGRSLRKNWNAAGYVSKTITPSASIIIGFAASYDNNFNGWPGVFVSIRGDSGTTGHIHVGTGDLPGTIEVSRGFYTSRTVLFTANVTQGWHYYELRVKVDSTVGYATLRVDGSQVGTFSGNTKNGGTSTNIDNFWLYGSANGTNITMYWDDLYVIDETGSAPYNTYLGELRVRTLSPTAAGSSTQFTPDSGSNYARVNEIPVSASNYVQGGTVGNRDTYTMADLPAAVGTILAVQNNIIAKKTDPASISLKPALKSGASVYYGSTTTLTPTDQAITDVRTVDPNTSTSWTASGVNALEAGMELA